MLIPAVRFSPVAYAENFYGRISFSGMWWSFLFRERCLWRHNWT